MPEFRYIEIFAMMRKNLKDTKLPLAKSLLQNEGGNDNLPEFFRIQ